MSDLSGSSRLQVLFEVALHDYEKQTGISLIEHPLAGKLRNCDSVESVIAVLHDEIRPHSILFRENDKILKSVEKAVLVLYKFSATATFGQDIGLHFPPVTAIHTGLGVLFSEVESVTGSYDSRDDLLETIEIFLKRLDIYTTIPLTVAMPEIFVKILVELLSTLGLATKQIKQGRLKKLGEKLLQKRDVEAVLQRLDRLTQEEARITAAQMFEVIYGLIQNIRVVMDDGRASTDHVMEALEIMQQLVSDQNKSKRDKLQQDIWRWISPPDPWKNHHIACESRHPGSAAWFIQGDPFSEWKASNAPSSCLWIHGKPGAGKSVVCSAIIDDIDAMRKAGLASLAFFYCDFREEEKTGLRGLLSSLLAQLGHQSDPYCQMLSDFYSEHAEGLRRPSDDELAECLKYLLSFPGLAPVYLIVDALDECSNISSIPSPREKVLAFIEELIELQFPNLRICVTSRPEADIKDVLDPLALHYISLHDERGQNRDIEYYIRSVINTDPRTRRWKVEDKELVIDVLTMKSDGMFRWVECEVVYICGCIPASVRRALDELPDTLDGTYARTLREINKADREFAHRMFQFVAVAPRPLRVEELAELLAFDFKAGPIPKFHEGWRPEDPVDAVLTVLSTCSNFFTIVDGGSLSETADGESLSELSYGPPPETDDNPEISSSKAHEDESFPEETDDGSRFGKTIQFSHFSVQEFLTSARLAESDYITLRRYHFSMTPAHTLAAQACLGVLLPLDGDVVTSDSLAKWPLAKYAARHWVNHAQFEDVSRNVEDGMRQLFDPSKSHLARCFRICNPDRPVLEQSQQAESPLTLQGTPLHYAALWGFDILLDFLIAEHAQEVDSRSFANDMTPLHLASMRGHIKATRILVEGGADTDARNGDGMSPSDMALAAGHMELVGMLNELGADVTTQDANRNLTDRGAGVTAQDEDGETPLHLASLMGRVEVVRTLIERGADVTAPDDDGKTPLHLASQMGRVEVVRVLIERGADVIAKDKVGKTPFDLASQHGKVEVARILMELGADATAQNDDGETDLESDLISSFWNRRSQGNARVDVKPERGADVIARNTGTSSARTLAYCSLGIVAIAVVLPFFIRIISRTSAGGRST